MPKKVTIAAFTVVLGGLSLMAAGCQSTGSGAHEHPEADHPQGEHPQGEHPQGEHPEGEHPEGDNG